MNFAQRELKTLSFSNEALDRGSIEETFFPWDLTVVNWEKQGLKTDLNKKLTWPGVPTEIGYLYKDRPIQWVDHYYYTMQTETIYKFDQQLGFDPVKRMAFRIPFLSYEDKILEDNDEYFIRLDIDGCARKYYKNSELVDLVKPVVSDKESWNRHKRHILEHYKKYCTDKEMERIYGPYREGCKAGDFSIRFRLTGFFWAPRDLMGVEKHLLAYYDYPELINDINRFQLDIYKEQMDKILKIIQPNVVFFEEDLSGRDGPMVSPKCIDEFITPCYREIIPFLKERGVKNVFVDTDGNITPVIPNFMNAGVDGFLPIDVNAGVDIVKVREKYPSIKLIGGFNKLAIVDGPEAIDTEFERLLPIIKQGGYLPGIDHQAAPATPLENYKYYIKRLGEIMREHRGNGI